jgi:integrase
MAFECLIWGALHYRHSHASLLIELGFSALLVSERLGHENIETTLETYAHLYPNKHGEVADKLEDLEGENYSADVSELEKKLETLE